MLESVPNNQNIRSGRTVSLVVVFHVQEGIEVDIAVEMYIGSMFPSAHTSCSKNRIRTLPSSTTCTAAIADACRRTSTGTSDASLIE